MFLGGRTISYNLSITIVLNIMINNGLNYQNIFLIKQNKLKPEFI